MRGYKGRESVMDDAIAFRVLWLAAPQCQDDVPLRLDLEQVVTSTPRPDVHPPPPFPALVSACTARP